MFYSTQSGLILRYYDHFICTGGKLHKFFKTDIYINDVLCITFKRLKRTIENNIFFSIIKILLHIYDYNRMNKD